MNPQAAREASFDLTPATVKKNVLVVGGGVAGMEAARCAALRGHKVTLCEAGNRLGGNLIPAGAHDFKKELNELNQWYQRQLKKLDVEIELGAKLDAQAVLYHKPDSVVLAVGAAPSCRRSPASSARTSWTASRPSPERTCGREHPGGRWRLGRL